MFILEFRIKGETFQRTNLYNYIKELFWYLHKKKDRSFRIKQKKKRESKILLNSVTQSQIPGTHIQRVRMINIIQMVFVFYGQTEIYLFHALLLLTIYMCVCQ